MPGFTEGCAGGCAGDDHPLAASVFRGAFRAVLSQEHWSQVETKSEPKQTGASGGSYSHVQRGNTTFTDQPVMHASLRQALSPAASKG